MKKVISLFTALVLALSLFTLPAAAVGTYSITHNYYLDGVLAKTIGTSGTIGASDWEMGYVFVSSLTSPVYNGNTYTLTGAESDGESFTGSTISCELLQSSGLTLNYSYTTPETISYTVTHIYSYANGEFIDSKSTTHTIGKSDLDKSVSIVSLEQTLFCDNTFTYLNASTQNCNSYAETDMLFGEELIGGLTINYTIDKMNTKYSVHCAASDCAFTGLNSSYFAGDTVSFSVSVPSRYSISSVYYENGNSTTTLTADSSLVNYSFVMPANDITIYVVSTLISGYIVKPISFNCTIEGLASSYNAGDKVTFSVLPFTKYEVTAVYYLYLSEITVTANPDFGTYSFIMPEKSIALYAEAEIPLSPTTTGTATTATANYKNITVEATAAAGSKLTVGGATNANIQAMKSALELELTSGAYGNDNFAVLPFSNSAVEISAAASNGKSTSVTDVIITSSINTEELMKLLSDALANETTVGTGNQENSVGELLWQGGDKNEKNVPQIFVNGGALFFAAHKNADGTVQLVQANPVTSLEANKVNTDFTALSCDFSIQGDEIKTCTYSPTASPFALFLVIDKEKLADYLAETGEDESDTSDATADTEKQNSDTTAERADDDSNTEQKENSDKQNNNSDDANPPTGVALGFGAALAAGLTAIALHKRKAK